MQIGLIDGITPHQKDAEIVNALKEAKRELGGSSDSVVAIKNEAGQIYRREVINGIHQEIELSCTLDELGLVDETAQGARKPKGIWVVFGPGRDLSLKGILADVQRIKR